MNPSKCIHLEPSPELYTDQSEYQRSQLIENPEFPGCFVESIMTAQL